MCQLILESRFRAKMNGHEFEHESISELMSETDSDMKAACLGFRTRTQTRTNIGQACPLITVPSFNLETFLILTTSNTRYFNIVDLA